MKPELCKSEREQVKSERRGEMNGEGMQKSEGIGWEKSKGRLRKGCKERMA